MSDAGRGDSKGAGTDGAGDAAPRDSIGVYLARQRQLRGISIEELCARTKIPRRNIERLEAGAFDHNPDGFARGFVRTVAQALGLDADEAVMRLMHEPDSDEEPGHGFSPQIWLLRLAAAALLLGGALAVWKAGVFFMGDRTEPAKTESALVVRPDAVRRLAEDLVLLPAPIASDDPILETTPEVGELLSPRIESLEPDVAPAASAP